MLIGIAYRSWHGVDEAQPIEGAGRAMINRTAFSVDDPRVKEAVRLYTRFRDEVRQAGARFLLVHFPLAYVVHPEDLTRWILHGVTNVEQEKAFNRDFCAFLNEQDIPCLNLTDDLVSTAKREKQRLYYWLDIHWTEAGNEMVAQLASRYLKRLNMAQVHR